MFDDVGMEIKILGYGSFQKWDITLQSFSRLLESCRVLLYSSFEKSLTCLARPVWWLERRQVFTRIYLVARTGRDPLLCLKFPIDNQYLLIQL